MPLQPAHQREPDLVVPGDGRTLSAFLEETLGDEAAGLIARGAIWVDGMRCRLCDMVPQAGAVIRVRRPPLEHAQRVIFEAGRVLFEDEDLIAVDKPAGVYVDATPWDADNHLRGALREWLAARDGREPVLHLVHRLDRDTSGVLLFSKNPAVNPELQRAFVQSRVSKTYLAHCAGAWHSDQLELITGHGRGRHGMLRIYPAGEVGQALPGKQVVKRMQTRFVVARRRDDAMLVWAYPVTGRTHQIRLHLALLGCPLVGDVKYGGPLVWHGERVAAHRLHAARLELAHPRGGEQLRLQAPLPVWVEPGVTA